jgi:dynein intermediate chain 2
MSDSFTY